MANNYVKISPSLLLKAVVRVCGELVGIIINTVVDKHPKSCKLPAGDILLDTNHLFHIYISPCIFSGKTRCQYFRIHAHNLRYKGFTMTYLVNIICDKQIIRSDIVNNSYS